MYDDPKQVANAGPDLIRELLGTSNNALLSAQADSVCGADYGTCSDERTNRGNVYRRRDLDTRARRLHVATPKLREGASSSATAARKRRGPRRPRPAT